jgi:predicted nuclease with TOPRIM domain
MPIGEDFKEDIKINRYRLERNAQEHSSVYLHYAEKLAEAKTEFNNAKDNLDYIKATTEMKYRKMKELPDNLKKVEASYSNLVHTDDDVLKAKIRITKAKEELDLMEAAVRSLEHRKDQISNLTKLWLGGYYSNPSQHSGESNSTQNSRDALNRKRKERDGNE